MGTNNNGKQGKYKDYYNVNELEASNYCVRSLGGDGIKRKRQVNHFISHKCFIGKVIIYKYSELASIMLICKKEKQLLVNTIHSLAECLKVGYEK